MANNGDIIDGLVDKLDKIDKQLDGIKKFIDEWEPYFQDLIDMESEVAQEVIDEQMELINTRVSEQLNGIRDKLVDTISSQVQVVKQKVEEFIAPISAFVTIDWENGTITPNITPDLTKLKEFAEGIIKMWIPKPAIKFAIDIPTKVFPKVSSISDKIQDIANYQMPELPEITIPPLEIEVEPITLGDILGS